MQSIDPSQSKVDQHTDSFPHIPSSLNIHSDGEDEPEPLNESSCPRVTRCSSSKSLSRKNPYSSTHSLLNKSKQRLSRSNTHRSQLRPRNRRTRPNTTRSHGHGHGKRHNQHHGPFRYEPPKYANWGMKIDSTEALREQILSLKKKCKSVSDENVLVKTEKRRMEKLLHRNDRKLKRLLNTVADTKSFVHDPNTADDTVSKFIGNEQRKFAITEVLNMLNGEHNVTVSLKKKLQKTKDELDTAQSIISHLEVEKQEIRSQHPMQPLQCEPDHDDLHQHGLDDERLQQNEQTIQHLEEQLEGYKAEVLECHTILESVTKSNEETAQRLNQKDDCIREHRAEIKELRETVSNEKFFNNKILDEITALKMTNKGLEESVEEQRGIEEQSKLQVRKLSNKLFDIEDELKDQISFYQGFEQKCIRYDQFIDTLLAQSQCDRESDGVQLFCRNLKEWIDRVQDDSCDIEETVRGAMHSLRMALECRHPMEQSVDDEKLDDSTPNTECTQNGNEHDDPDRDESDMDQSELVHLFTENTSTTMHRGTPSGGLSPNRMDSSEMTSETFNGTNSENVPSNESTETTPPPLIRQQAPMTPPEQSPNAPITETEMASVVVQEEAALLHDVEVESPENEHSEITEGNDSNEEESKTQLPDTVLQQDQ